MNRREALVAVGGVLGAGAAVTAVIPVGAQEDDGEGDENGADEGNGEGEEGGESEDGGESGEGNESEDGGGGGGGGTETVSIVDNAFEPAELAVEPGTTVEWTWEGQADHNVDPGEIPEDADWEGHTDLQADGEYSHTFEVEGDYNYVCTPHVGVGMTGTITVDPEAGQQAAEADVDIHDLGVPIQKHFVGIASFLATFVSLVFTFYLLKYGESANTSSPGRDR